MNKNSVVVVCDSYYLSVKSGDPSSRSPSPNRSLKGFNLFRVISQKIGRSIRHSKEYKCTNLDEDGDSISSSNSVRRSSEKPSDGKQHSMSDCDYFYKNEDGLVILKKNFPSKAKIQEQKHGKKCLKFSTPCRHHHSSGSDTCSSNDDFSESNDIDHKTKRSHSSSNESSSSSSSSADSFRQTNAVPRKELKNLNLNSKSLSCFSLSQLKDLSDRRESNTKEKRIKKSPQKILRQPATHTYVRGISGLPTLKVIKTRACYYNQYSRG